MNDRRPIGRVTARTVVKGPISIVAAAGAFVEDGSVSIDYRGLSVAWSIDGCPPSAARDLTDLVSPLEWLDASQSRDDVRYAMEKALLEAAERAALDAASSAELPAHDHDRDSREDAAE